MPNISELGFAPKFVNDYMVAQLTLFGVFSGLEQISLILPTSPISIDEVYTEYSATLGTQDPMLIQYERLLKFNPSTFYRHKREQIAYYLYCTTLSKMIDSQRVFAEALGRGDAAAQDVMSWMKTSGGYAPDALNVSFHNFRVNQVSETRDLLPLVSKKTIFVSKILVEYDFHTIDSSPAIYT